jgi:hypothetical protein
VTVLSQSERESGPAKSNHPPHFPLAVPQSQIIC